MTLALELPQELEREFMAEAARLGPPQADYALRVLTHGRLPAAGVERPGTGADVVAFWEREELIGTRSDVTDPAEHARQLREQAQRRFGT